MELLPNLREAYNVGIESNDIIYAGYALSFINRLQFFGGESLQSIYQKMQGYFQFTSKINSVISRHQILTWARVVVDLLDIDAPESVFEDLTADTDHHKFLLGLNDDMNLQLPLANYYTAKSFYHYLLDEMNKSWEFALKADPLMNSVVGLTEWAEQIIFKVLTQLSLMMEGKQFSRKERKTLSNHLKLMKKWSISAPENYDSKYQLAMAESMQLKNKLNEAHQYYDAAIMAGKKYATPYMIAISLERKAKLLEKQNDLRQSQTLISQAMNEYYHWGAKQKVISLRNQYSFLFKDGESQAYHTSNLSSTAMDLQSILQAAQTLSGEVVLDQLLEKLLNILIRNAGAQNAYLIQSKAKKLHVEAQSRMKNGNNCEVYSLVLEDVPYISHKVVRKVFASKQLEIIDDLATEASLLVDEQTKNTDARSILCMPVLSKGEIIAIIYLDNNLSSHVFTTERLELLEILSGQIAISLENARHYLDLEEKVKERTLTIEQQKLALEESKQQSDALLLNILPEDIAEELKTNGFCQPKRYESVTIMFTDFVKFTKMSEKLTPEEIVEIVDYQYKAFDRIIEKHKIEKIKTIGDAYMCVSGLPKISDDHAKRMVNAALEISAFVSEYIEERKAANLTWCDIRIGLHSGPVVAGVVGHNKFAFDIWGDSVNTASRIQSEAEPGKINISNTTYELVKEDFECLHRGKIKAKYKGEIDMYYITQ
jgi:class 3 adenylate cyclase